MYSADKFLCVSLYSRCVSACNSVCVHYYNYLLLTTCSFCTFIYAARLLPADILSVRDVIRQQLGYNITLFPSLCALIWLLYQSTLSSRLVITLKS
jgi:hypothetical protein